ncbi:hypothetical protein ACIBI9_66745 [Nonomuraea sp. NPDC050451]|uniref:hypothetical protein n=1 Tax=Nonomuraea sp. NPDC050451 TaxID=3364364 RepID=UPI00379FF7DC
MIGSGSVRSSAACLTTTREQLQKPLEAKNGWQIHPLSTWGRPGEGAELVAVGVVFSRDCVVTMRPDGAASFRFTGFDRNLGEPGEYGCTPIAYLPPMTTH